MPPSGPPYLGHWSHRASCMAARRLPSRYAISAIFAFALADYCSLGGFAAVAHGLGVVGR